MFNPLSRAEMIVAVGRVLKSAAGGGPPDEYRRSQLLSAYSIARHLAAEERAAAGLMRWFRDELDSLLQEAASDWRGDPATRDVVARVAERVRSEAGIDELGAELTDLMLALRAAGDQSSRALGQSLRALLRELCDREVEALAEAPA